MSKLLIFRSRFANQITISQFHHHRLIQISLFSNYSHKLNSPSSPLHYQSRRHEEDSRNVRVSVWWDFENCNLPSTINVYRVSHCITSAIRNIGIKGSVQITAFGDVSQLSRINQEALSSIGITLFHIPYGGKNSADRSILVDLMYWVSQNPPPAHIFLISSDGDFSKILHRLRMNNYNILLSCNSAPSVLCSAASITWDWTSLLKAEENLTPKHFNQPPDSSWYGHYKVSLEDPFIVNESSPRSVANELTTSGSVPVVRTIPMDIIKDISHILSLNPEGISIIELRAELGRTNIDKNFYGYKTFSLFLKSMPEILKVENRPNGLHHIHGVELKVDETSMTPVTDNDNRDFHNSFKKNGEVNNRDVLDSLKLSGGDDDRGSLDYGRDVLDSLDLKEFPSKSSGCSKQVEELPVEVPEPRMKVEEVKRYEETDCQLSSGEENHRMRFFSWNWKDWFVVSSSDLAEQVKENERKLDESTIIGEINGERCDANFTGDSVWNNITKWWRWWRSGVDSDKPSEEECSEEIEKKMNADCEKMAIFYNESFWNEMQVFMDTPSGSELIMLSKNRKEMAQNLQKHGPPSLRSLTGSDLNHLINLLISNKKWITESPLHTFPFKFCISSSEIKSSTNSHLSNRLSSAFSVSNNTKNKNQEQPVLHSKKCRKEILADCQKLVAEIVKKYPEGLNIGCFRKIFLQKYRYCLDPKALGYKKLVNLLEIMAGAKIEDNYLYPSNVVEKNYTRGGMANLKTKKRDLIMKL